MSFMIKFIIVLFFLMTSMLNAGNDRSGSYGAIELLFSPSARASGMGETGVSHVHGKSFYFNPGSLGLFALENKITISGFPKKSNYLADIKYYDNTSSIPLQKSNNNSKFLFALGHNYSVIKLGTFEEITYNQPNGTGQFYTPILKNYSATFSVAYIGRVQYGVGLTIKIFKEIILQSSKNGLAFDIGFISRYPINFENSQFYILPTFGVAVSNLGADIEFIGYGAGLSRGQNSRISNGYSTSLPKRKSIGFSFEFGIKKNNLDEEKNTMINILPTLELSKILNNAWFPVYGLELGVAQMLYYRIGKNKGLITGYNEKSNTNGFTFNSTGLFKLIQNSSSSKSTRTGINKLFTDIISIEYSFANSVIMKSYHEIIVTYQL